MQGTGVRGSRKHVLDWLARESFVDQMNQLLTSAAATISVADMWQPVGHDMSEEFEIPKFCKRTNEGCFSDVALSDWWLPIGRREKGVTWDLLSTCLVNQRRGLLLVEAKAHEDEIDFTGKELERDASIQSRKNHDHIGQRLAETTAQLDERVDGIVQLSLLSHYQLANRIAWAWKLAECGIPTVLLYLGFLGDSYFRADYFRNHDHFQRIMGAYMNGVIPLSLPGKRIAGTGDASLQIVVESIPVLAVSV
jgi:hypothetical protein